MYPLSARLWRTEARNDSLFHRCRHWLRPHLQDLGPFGRRNPQVTEGSPGRATPGQATSVIPPSHAGSPTPLDPYCVCVYVLAGME